MKNFIRKSSVVALMALPLLSHAYDIACGGGYVKSISDDTYVGALRFTVVKVAPSLQDPVRAYPGNLMLLHNSVADSDALKSEANRIRGVLHAAMHAGSYVKFYYGGWSGACHDVARVQVCKDEASCN